MSRSPIDLFDDPPWSGEAPVHEVPTVSPRPDLMASLTLVALLLFSMALPWFTGRVTPQSGTSPLSGSLSRGWSPGTEDWGILMMVLGALTALAIVIGMLWPRRPLLVTLLVVATILAVVTVAEAFSFGDPWPDLRAAYGAWIGVPAIVFAWCCIAVATVLDLRWRPARRHRPLHHPHG
ncbi:MAG: hypothetical protein ACRDZR_09220 [Acidimicrobiales bacterium]